MNSPLTNFRERGFSLVESVIGMLIGMIAIIVIMEVFALSEERKRTTSGGGDAQTSAMLAMDALQRDIGQAGYGFANMRLLGCNIQLAALPAGVGLPLLPAVIDSPLIPAGDANTNVLNVAYGMANDQADGYVVTGQTGGSYTISGGTLIRVAERVVAVPNNCALNTLQLGTVTAVNAGTVQLNTSANGTALYNLGINPVFKSYAIRNGSLTMCDMMVSDCTSEDAGDLANDALWLPVAAGIVNLQVFYGRDTSTPMDGVVDVYDRTVPANQCEWARVSALRIAVVGRSAQFDRREDTRGAVTVALPQLADGTQIDVSENPDGSANPAWGNYRYQVYETVVPLRNIAWMGVPAGC